ncbi:hypothetical protein [Nodularia spumigena]|uniref:hypothetical protein n=1 Tax=Nodularia spumigena TaxID=70799 RepID=UPI000D3117D0|nr:hypothetical protein [Nodularia spumigena]
MFATIKSFIGNVEIEMLNDPSKVRKAINGTKITLGNVITIGKDSKVTFTCANGRTVIKTAGTYGLYDLCPDEVRMNNEATLP